MAKTNAFKIAELIRGIEFDVDNDVISTQKNINSKTKSRGNATRTATTEFALDTFAHADFRAARYVVAMSRGTDFHSTEIMLVHDGSVVTMTQYGTLKDNNLRVLKDGCILNSQACLLISKKKAANLRPFLNSLI